MFFKIFIISSLLPACVHSASLQNSPTRTRYLTWPEGTELDEMSFIDRLVKSDVIVLAENHFRAPIQLAEARIISGVGKVLAGRRGFDVGWEFLNTEDQQKIDESFNDIPVYRFDAPSFRLLFGLDHENEKSYDVILQAIKSHDGRLIGSNLSYKDRSLVVQEGLLAFSASERLRNGYDCSSFYKERFFQKMKAHLDSDKMSRYFEAQCACDNAMANAVVARKVQRPYLTIVGAFHAEFGLGLVEQLELRKIHNISVIRIIGASRFKDEMFSKDFKLGGKAIADYVVVVPEDSSNSL